MDLAEVILDKDAIEALGDEYKNLKHKTKYDRVVLGQVAELERALAAVDSGEKVISLHQTMKRSIRSSGLPTLGFAPAWMQGRKWWCRVYSDGRINFSHGANFPTLSPAIRFPTQTYDRSISFSQRAGGISGAHRKPWMQGWTTVPVIPPAHRPKSLRGLQLIWEAQWQTRVPDPDPALVRPLGNGLATVVAEWDLTPIEAECLRYL